MLRKLNTRLKLQDFSGFSEDSYLPLPGMMSGEVHCSGVTSNKLLPYGLFFYFVPESVSLYILASFEHYEPPAPVPLVLGPQARVSVPDLLRNILHGAGRD